MLFLPFRIAAADRSPLELTQPLEVYMQVSLDKSFLLTEHKGWERSEDAC